MSTDVCPTSRRQFLTVPAALHSFLISKPSARRFNVLLILVDDLRPQLRCYGHSQMKTPHIDQLAAEGLRFERAYCQQALCAPSRVSLLTGARPDTTRVYDLQTPLQTLRPGLVSLPLHFRKHGYETVSLGKVYHHLREDPLAWSEPPWRPKGNWAGGGYVLPSSIGLVRKRDAALAAWQKAHSRGQLPQTGFGPPWEAAPAPDHAYPDGQICERAIAELRRLRHRPFFLAVGFHKPHLPFTAPKKYWDLYQPEELPLPERRRWPDNTPEIATTNWSELRAYAGIPKRGPLDDRIARRLVHGYYACVSFIDAQIGKLLAELDRLGLRRNTIVVLWGDNGWKLGEYGAWCKHTNFELDTRIPLIISIPGQKNAGKSTKALVESVDMYPTLAEVCGLPIPAHCEGISLLPLVEDPERRWKQAAFSQYPRSPLMGYSVRTERWRYTEWIDTTRQEVKARELYDHSSTDTPSANLAGLPTYRETVNRLSALLDRGRGWRKVQSELARRY